MVVLFYTFTVVTSDVYIYTFSSAISHLVAPIKKPQCCACMKTFDHRETPVEKSEKETGFGRCAAALRISEDLVTEKKQAAMEMRCYRKILRISNKDHHHATNEEVHAKIQQATGLHKDLLTIVKRYKLKWYGHVSHSPCLTKTILQGKVQGANRQGRQKERWEDSIRE